MYSYDAELTVALLGEAQPHVQIWSVVIQLHGDFLLLISPYPAVVTIDEVTGMKGSIITCVIKSSLFTVSIKSWNMTILAA